MAQLSTIQKRMKSVASIGKMTRAMQLISSVKMRQSRRQFLEALPFFSHCTTILLDVLAEHPVYRAPVDRRRQSKKPGETWNIRVYVMTGDRGLAGTYNTDVMKAALRLIEIREEKARRGNLVPHTQIRVMGKVGKEYLLSLGYDVDTNFSYSINNPDYYQAAELAEAILANYEAGQCDEVYMVFTQMTSPLVRRPIYTRLLPADPSDLSFLIESIRNDPSTLLTEDDFGFMDDQNLRFDYSDNIDTLLSYLYSTTLGGLMYGALTEAFASEQTARMTSMDSASKNSSELYAKLERERNRIRQAQITMELNEIVSGAELLSQENQLEKK